MKKLAITIFLLASLGLTANGVNESDKSISLGLGVFHQKDIYEKEDENNVVPLPIITMKYKNIYYEAPAELGYNIFQTKNLKLSTYVRYNLFTAYRPKDMIDEFKGMDKRKDDLHVGLSTKYIFTSIGTMFDSRVSTDISGKSKGIVAKVALSQPIPLGNKVIINPSIAVNYMSDKYTNYYFGITDDEAQRGINKGVAYKPSDSFNVESSITAVYMVNDKFNILLHTSYTKYDKSIKDSPLVKEDDSFTFGAGFVYTFGF